MTYVIPISSMCTNTTYLSCFFLVLPSCPYMPLLPSCFSVGYYLLMLYCMSAMLGLSHAGLAEKLQPDHFSAKVVLTICASSRRISQTDISTCCDMAPQLRTQHSPRVACIYLSKMSKMSNRILLSAGHTPIIVCLTHTADTCTECDHRRA